jgi:hypothetical protein
VAVSVKMSVFCNFAPCNVLEIDRCFRGTYCLHHQGDAPTSQKAVILSYLGYSASVRFVKSSG